MPNWPLISGTMNSISHPGPASRLVPHASLSCKSWTMLCGGSALGPVVMMTPPVPAAVVDTHLIRYPLFHPGELTMGGPKNSPNVAGWLYIGRRPDCACRMNGPPVASFVVCGCGRPATVAPACTAVPCAAAISRAPWSDECGNDVGGFVPDAARGGVRPGLTSP